MVTAHSGSRGAATTLPPHFAIRATFRVNRPPFRLPTWLVLATLGVASALPLGAQQDAERTSSLGLSSTGALSVHVGASRIVRGARGVEGGVTLDLGYLATPRLRVLTDLSFLRSLSYEERVEHENRTYRDVFYDLSGHVALSAHANAPTSRITPYALAGVGIHLLTSSFGSVVLDTRYNTNNFGLLAGGGVRVRGGPGSRRAAFVEIRRIQAKDVRRLNLQLGASLLFNDLVRP